MIIAGTGHRPDKLGGYEPQATNRVIDFATEVLRHHQPSTVITGMAQGWDMALAQAAVNLGIPFHAYIPFVGQELVWPANTRSYYRALLRLAQHVTIVTDGAYSKLAMQKRNQAMVDNCELLLALYNGSKGGTENCLVYAMLVGKPYINYWPQFIANQRPEDLPVSDWLTGI